MKRTASATTTQELTTTQRMAIGLVAVSVSLFSLAFGVALIASPGANSLFLPPDMSRPLPRSTATAVTLSWVVPGNSAADTQPIAYDLRYSTDPLTEDTFSSVTPVIIRHPLAPAGGTETVTVTGLQPSTTYFFAWKTTDAGGHVSPLSTVTATTTADLATACVPAFFCSAWSICTDGVQNRSCGATNGCQSDLGLPVTQQACTGPLVEPARVVNPVLAIGAAAGQQPNVRLLNPENGTIIRDFAAFDATMMNGIQTATGDLTGDHQVDIVAGTGPGSLPLIKMFRPDGTLVASLSPYPLETTSGVAVAVGDVDGDGVDELITVPAATTSQVRIWKYDADLLTFTQIAQTLAFDQSYQPGFTLSAGDLDNDGRAEIIVAPGTNGGMVAVLQLTETKQLQIVRTFKVYGGPIADGFFTAIADVYGHGQNTIVTVPRSSLTTPLKVYGATGVEQMNFLPKVYQLGKVTGASSGDINHDGRDEVMVTLIQNGQTVQYAYQYNDLQAQWYPIRRQIVTTGRAVDRLRRGGP